MLCCSCCHSDDRSAGADSRVPLISSNGEPSYPHRMERNTSEYLRPTSCDGHPGEGEEAEDGKCQHSFDQVYNLKDHLGKGSTSSCFKCIHKISGNVLAVKVIDKRRIAVMYNELLAQFRQEAQILRILHHPHIIRLFEVFESNDSLMLVRLYVLP